MTKRYVSQIPKYDGSYGKYLDTILQESLFLCAKMNEMYMEYNRLQMEHFSSPIKNHFKNVKSKVSISSI